MVLLSTPEVTRGLRAPDFSLRSTEGGSKSLADIAGKGGTVLAFICNHCPYVQAIVDRIASEAQALQAKDIGVAAIMPNDVQSYPDDSFEHMVDFARRHGFSFPYMIDETQEVSRAYGAVCTPDFFGFGPDLRLHYRGRLDDGGKSGVPKRRELYEAMVRVAEGGAAAEDQFPAMGCSIKWGLA